MLARNLCNLEANNVQPDIIYVEHTNYFTVEHSSNAHQDSLCSEIPHLGCSLVKVIYLQYHVPKSRICGSQLGEQQRTISDPTKVTEAGDLRLREETPVVMPRFLSLDTVAEVDVGDFVFLYRWLPLLDE